jgi:hypothetical protein
MNEPEPLIKLKVTVPVGEEPATIAMHGVGGPRMPDEGQLSVVDEGTKVAEMATNVLPVEVPSP